MQMEHKKWLEIVFYSNAQIERTLLLIAPICDQVTRLGGA